MPEARLVIFTRYPTPGAAKTRLIPALGAAGAAALHRRLTEHTVAAARAAGLPFELWTTGGDEAAFREWLGALVVRSQGEGGLGERLLRAAAPHPVIFIGTDAPDLVPAHLRAAADAVASGRSVIGAAEDGGYWLLGLPEAVPGVFDGIAWSTDTVFAATLGRLQAAGHAPLRLPTLCDLDTPADLPRWPDLVP
ncbi:MAG: TIGR04282 family arsenosugar biosynthesis glycosyltransferase [Acetobacteraceae bacterium]|nr:TIGR04282 family arsenosugar biosynthesis glycosyltransferase [Acetobacteraceae bacterium]